ncbi:hypothetical protein AY601_2013 [Pedobacter cryoconitis]|uniref:Uncharacterized protein n=1 Tax=Pedobacter cryoconitis TaxID=188932 RepID=A0A127VCG3_9SPHI|nr:hypothetical protein AY601_2013 [Pedobacter cryoconitis]
MAAYRAGGLQVRKKEAVGHFGLYATGMVHEHDLGQKPFELFFEPQAPVIWDDTENDTIDHGRGVDHQLRHRKIIMFLQVLYLFRRYKNEIHFLMWRSIIFIGSHDMDRLVRKSTQPPLNGAVITDVIDEVCVQGQKFDLCRYLFDDLPSVQRWSTQIIGAGISMMENR